MITALSTYIAVLILIVLLVIWFLSWIKERKELANYENLTHIKVYHCSRCNAVYTATAKNRRALCPSCNHQNKTLRF